MFSLNEGGQPAVGGVEPPRVSAITYAEWAAFGVLLLLLVALWYFIRFGWPGAREQQAANGMHPMPEEVVNALLAPGRTPQPMPDPVKKDLTKSKPVQSTVSGSSSNSIPPEVLKYLSASK